VRWDEQTLDTGGNHPTNGLHLSHSGL
jgi:hypothetical protein